MVNLIVVLPPEGHAPSAEETSLLEVADVIIAVEGGVTVVDVSIGIEEDAVVRGVGVVRDGSVDRLAR